MPPRGEKLTMPEYTTPNNERFIWNDHYSIMVCMNANPNYVQPTLSIWEMQKILELYYQGEVSYRFKGFDYIFALKDEKIVIEGIIKDGRKKGYSNSLTIFVPDWVEAIRMVQLSASENTLANANPTEDLI